MIENVLTRRNCSARVKLTVKSLLSLALVACAVLLPQLVHLVSGSAGGVQWLPMYLPVLVGGCLLGFSWGLGIGIASPLVSFLLTSLWGNPMPVAARLPFMMIELAVNAAVTGLFAKRISANGLYAFAAVWTAQITGRAMFLALAWVFRAPMPFTPAMIWAQIRVGWMGLLAQAVLVPCIVLLVRAILQREKKA